MLRPGEKKLDKDAVRDLILSDKWEAGKHSVFQRFEQDAYTGRNNTDLAKRLDKAGDEYGAAYEHLNSMARKYSDTFLGEYGSISYSNAKQMARYGASTYFEYLLTNEVDRRPYNVR